MDYRKNCRALLNELVVILIGSGAGSAWAAVQPVKPISAGNISSSQASAQSSNAAGQAARAKIVEEYGRTPISFEPNLGQTNPSVQYFACGPNYGKPIAAEGRRNEQDGGTSSFFH